MTRTETALRLRDHALSILRQHGSYQPVRDQKFLMWNGESFRMLLRTPFQKWATPDAAAKTLAASLDAPIDHAKYLAAQYDVKLPEALPYGLDIWRGKKVFSLEWADDGRSRIIGFKRGDWEVEFLALSPEEAGVVSDAR
jgi:hypothetical protein